jgi:hypothetical protein
MPEMAYTLRLPDFSLPTWEAVQGIFKDSNLQNIREIILHLIFIIW